MNLQYLGGTGGHSTGTTEVLTHEVPRGGGGRTVPLGGEEITGKQVQEDGLVRSSIEQSSFAGFAEAHRRRRR